MWRDHWSLSPTQRLRRYLLLLIIVGSTVSTFFCGFALTLDWLVSRNPPYGDDTGLGIICISLLFALICSAVILSAFKQKFMTR